MTTGKDVAQRLVGGQAPPDSPEIEALKAEAKNLLSQAADLARRGEWEAASWRAVDAAGIIFTFAAYRGQGTPNNPTGRGYFIGHRYRAKRVT